MTDPIRLGTRGSQLALWQANETARLLASAGHKVEIIIIRTSGDKRQDVPLAAVGGKGLFIKELEEALERDEIDIAVHSLKDVPSLIPEGFVLAGYLERANPCDAWVHPNGTPLAGLPSGSIVGTSSPRRRAQLLERYPSLRIEPIRGNVPTRINKASAGEFAGIVLASAGLIRLGLDGEITSLFSVDEMVPAAGQGIVAFECLAANERARSAARSINREASEIAANCERGVLQKFGEQLDCYSAIAVHASQAAGVITIRAFCSDYDGKSAIHVSRSGSDPIELTGAVYDELLSKGALELVRATRSA